MRQNEQSIYGADTDEVRNETAELARGQTAQELIEHSIDAIRNGEIAAVQAALTEALKLARTEEMGVDNMNALAIELIGRINRLEAPQPAKDELIRTIEASCRGLLQTA